MIPTVPMVGDIFFPLIEIDDRITERNRINSYKIIYAQNAVCGSIQKQKDKNNVQKI